MTTDDDYDDHELTATLCWPNFIQMIPSDNTTKTILILFLLTSGSHPGLAEASSSSSLLASAPASSSSFTCNQDHLSNLGNYGCTEYPIRIQFGPNGRQLSGRHANWAADDLGNKNNVFKI